MTSLDVLRMTLSDPLVASDFDTKFYILSCKCVEHKVFIISYVCQKWFNSLFPWDPQESRPDSIP